MLQLFTIYYSRARAHGQMKTRKIALINLLAVRSQKYLYRVGKANRASIQRRLRDQKRIYHNCVSHVRVGAKRIITVYIYMRIDRGDEEYLYSEEARSRCVVAAGENGALNILPASFWPRLIARKASWRERGSEITLEIRENCSPKADLSPRALNVRPVVYIYTRPRRSLQLVSRLLPLFYPSFHHFYATLFGSADHFTLPVRACARGGL